MRSVLLVLALLVPSAAAQSALGIDQSAMDPTVRPQDDLFRHVNGAWLSTVEIPADRSRYGSFDQLREAAETNLRAIVEDAAAGRVDDPDAARIAAAYTAYQDSARVEALGVAPLQPDLARIDAVDSPTDLVQYFAGNVSSFGPAPLAGFVGVDDRDSDRHLLFLTQSGTGLPDRSYYFDDRFAETRQAYLSYLETLYDLAGWPGGAAAAQTTLDVETDLARLQWTRVENRDSEATYNPRAVADLARDYPTLAVHQMLAVLGVSPDSVIVRQPSYVAGLDSLLAARPLSDWQTYARARTLSEAADLLPRAFVEADFAFYGQTLRGSESDRPRWKKAVAMASGALGESIGRIYVERHYPDEAAARMEALILNLQEAFRRSIVANPWMGEATKTQALAKLGTYVFKIGAPDDWETYDGLELSPSDLVGNARAIAAWRRADNLAELGEAPDRSEWGMTPQTVNAYYNPAFNEIVFPAGILQPPFFNVAADDAVNYGGIGAVIGHEFSHGFDDQGAQYDADGNLRNWWTDADKAQFETLTDQLVAQYNGYAPFGDAAVNGELTLGENIADLAGLTMAYRAYRLSLDTDGDGTVSAAEEAPVIDGLTGTQRFFMGWAQVWRITHREPYLRQLLQVDSHSPGEYRANGPLAHIPAFYDAFGVEPGDALYLPPDARIDLW